MYNVNISTRYGVAMSILDADVLALTRAFAAIQSAVMSHGG
jgi:hypothetical protein